jgi:hypothetical protein
LFGKHEFAAAKIVIRLRQEDSHLHGKHNVSIEVAVQDYRPLVLAFGRLQCGATAGNSHHFYAACGSNPTQGSVEYTMTSPLGFDYTGRENGQGINFEIDQKNPIPLKS